MSWKLKKQQLLLLTYPSPNSQVQIVFSHIIWCKNDCRYTVASQSFAFAPWITVQCPVSFCWHIICLAGLTKNPNVFFSVHCILISLHPCLFIMFCSVPLIAWYLAWFWYCHACYYCISPYTTCIPCKCFPKYPLPWSYFYFPMVFPIYLCNLLVCFK